MKTILNNVIIMLVAGIIFQSCSKEFDSGDDSGIQKEGTVIHNLVIDGNKTIIKEVDGVYYFSEDEILSEKQFNYLKRLSNKNLSTEERSTISTNLSRRWPNAVVYYEIGSTSKQNTILNAINHIKERSVIQFFPRTNQPNYIYFRDSNANQSPVGMIGGRQDVELYNNHMGITVHEILHALGIFHEQSRPDRDNYIQIHTQNIQDGKGHNFNIAPAEGIGGFDFGSIMMYGHDSFSKNGFSTITKINGSVYAIQRDSLSLGDITGLAAMYGALIKGPSQICDEGIYTISSPSTISLENASGIATLTSLGNNQWKVSRTGSSSGRVSLKSVNANGKSTSKLIVVGDLIDAKISGVINNIVNPGSFEFSLSGAYYIGSSLVWNVTSNTNNVSLTRLGDSVIVNVNTWNPSGLNMIILTAKFTTTCGSEITLTKTMGAGHGGPIEET